MSNPTPNSKIAEILQHAMNTGFAVASGLQSIEESHVIESRLATQLQQLMIEARIDELMAYMVAHVGAMTHAATRDITSRLKELQAQLNKEVDNG